MWRSVALALAFAVSTPLAHAARHIDENGLEWEDPVEEVIVPDSPTPERELNAADDRDFSPDQTAAEHALATRSLVKKPVDQLLAGACAQIVELKDKFPKARISRTTRYFVPMFPAGKDGGLQLQDRRSCINMEGSCVVDQFLYNWDGNGKPWGRRWKRSEIAFRFGKGAGQSYYNATNALDPCRTVAADPDVYKAGTVVYIPSLRGKLCPQNGKPVDGCFVVGDTGSAIQGAGRFDLFVGECARYNKGSSDCEDGLMESFHAPAGADFYLVGRHNMLAKFLREEADLLIRNDWRTGLLP